MTHTPSITVGKKIYNFNRCLKGIDIPLTTPANPLLPNFSVLLLCTRRQLAQTILAARSLEKCLEAVSAYTLRMTVTCCAESRMSLYSQTPLPYLSGKGVQEFRLYTFHVIYIGECSRVIQFKSNMNICDDEKQKSKEYC